MGIGLRVFLVNDDDSIQRLSLARYERLRRDPEERLPQYAGRRVRYALVILEMADRKPLEILGIQYSFLDFDPVGRIDPADREKEARLAMEMLPPLAKKQKRPHVVDARYRFAKKRFDDEYKWAPTPEIEAAIVEAIFGKDRG
ncbi:MAG: hypothetical protein GTO12_01230 [Proteobacteria bacterium]|nr:hypothetical protein [Pseudomonadota bacterium]